MQPLSGNQRPNLLTSLICTVPATRHASLQRPPSFLEMQQNPHVLLTFGRVENPSRLPHKTTLQRPKVSAKPMPQAAISSAPRRGRKLLPKWGPKTSGHFWSIGGHKSKMLLWTTLSPSSTCGVLVDAVRSEAGGILGGLSWELWKTQPITSWPHGFWCFWMLFGRWLRFRKILIIYWFELSYCIFSWHLSLVIRMLVWHLAFHVNTICRNLQRPGWTDMTSIHNLTFKRFVDGNWITLQNGLEHPFPWPGRQLRLIIPAPAFGLIREPGACYSLTFSSCAFWWGPPWRIATTWLAQPRLPLRMSRELDPSYVIKPR